MKIAVIDLDSICYAIGNGNKIADGNGDWKRDEKGRLLYVDKTEDELRSSADFYMKQLLAGGEFTHYIAYMKGTDTTTRRKEINSEYKANRSDIPPHWWNFVTNDLHIRWNAHYVNHMEVDDMVNITRLRLPDSHIVAIDGDLLSLKGVHYNWKKGEWIVKNKADEEIKFWTDMISGQVGDNVKGLPGRGPAYAKKIFVDFFDHGEPFHSLVLRAYVRDLGEYHGIAEFYKNYASLKILEFDSSVTIPEPTLVSFN